MITTSLDHLADHVRHLKIPHGSMVVIHSSLFHFGVFKGGAPAFSNMLESVFDDSYTILMPAFNWGFPKTKVWNYHTTKSQCGLLTEYVRKLPGTLRTIHPLHSLVARGPRAEWLASTISRSSFGDGSAFDKMIQSGAYNLSLGSEFIGGATFCHVAEERMRVPYRFYKDFPGEVTDAKNERVPVDFNMYVRVIEDDYEYVNTWEIFWEDALRHGLARYDRYKQQTPIFLMNVRDAHEFLMDRMGRDPFYVAKKMPRFTQREG